MDEVVEALLKLVFEAGFNRGWVRSDVPAELPPSLVTTLNWEDFKQSLPDEIINVRLMKVGL